MSPAKMVEPIEMSCRELTCVGPRNHVLDGVEIPPQERAIFLGCPANGKALGVCCDVCSKRDHSLSIMA